MTRGIFVFIMMIAVSMSANAASVRGTSTASRNGVATAQNQTVNPASSYTYNYMYPYLNNQMRTTLKPFDATDPTTSPINAVVRTEPLSAPRRVVSRPAPATNSARVAANTASVASTTSARRVVPRSNTSARAAINNNARVANTGRRVVSRAGAITPHINNSASRSQNSAIFSTKITPQATSAARCLADYTECMNQYCERTDTKYNRCYCSSKLAQIDAEYQPQIESLVMQIAALQSGNPTIDIDDFNEYWTEKISKYTGDNSWQNIDDALNINWSSMESRVRGQNAFITGHEYCSQHLSGCFYMSSNLRDAYRSTIANDCAVYKEGLERLKSVAESVVQGYKE